MVKPAKKRKLRKLSPASREAVARETLSGTTTRRQVARKYKISLRTITTALQKAETGQFTDAPRSGRPRKYTEEDKQRVKQLAEADPERSIRRVTKALEAEGGPAISKTTVGHILHEAGFLPLEPEKVQLNPGLNSTFKKLSENLVRFQETKRFADDARTVFNSMLEHLGGSSGLEFGKILGETSTKYGLESEHGRTMQKASEMFSKLDEEERTYHDYVKNYCLDSFASIDQDAETIDNVSDGGKDLKTVTEEMFVAKRKLRNAKKNRESYREQAEIAKKAFEVRKEAIEHVAPKIALHRLSQIEAVRTFIEAQRVFHLRAAAVIENALPFL